MNYCTKNKKTEKSFKFIIEVFKYLKREITGSFNGVLFIKDEVEKNIEIVFI